MRYTKRFFFESDVISFENKTVSLILAKTKLLHRFCMELPFGHAVTMKTQNYANWMRFVPFFALRVSNMFLFYIRMNYFVCNKYRIFDQIHIGRYETYGRIEAMRIQNQMTKSDLFNVNSWNGQITYGGKVYASFWKNLCSATQIT